MALIEVDNKGNVNILNLTDYSVVDSFSGGTGRIDSAVFLDPGNRFVYLQKDTGSHHVYDTLTSTLADYTGSIGLTFRSDPFSCQLYNLDAGNFNIHSFNFTVDSNLTMSYLFPTIPSPIPPSSPPSSKEAH